MLRVTKIFHFEMAHAIHGYSGACKNIHGHSYELHVTVAGAGNDDYIPAPGFVIDFKDLKKIVNSLVIDYFDHKLVLSRNFLNDNPSFSSPENLVIWNAEPTAENLLIFMKKTLSENLTDEINLVQLKLFETKNSFAEWVSDKIF